MNALWILNQTLHKTDFVAERCKTIIVWKRSTDVFFLYTEVKNVLLSFLRTTCKNLKNLLVFFSMVQVLQKIFSVDLIFECKKYHLNNVYIIVFHLCQVLEANLFHDNPQMKFAKTGPNGGSLRCVERLSIWSLIVTFKTKSEYQRLQI